MGVFTIIYTVMGGMRAVVWTDFAGVREDGRRRVRDHLHPVVAGREL